jgi:hypothetical protein
MAERIIPPLAWAFSPPRCPTLCRFACIATFDPAEPLIRYSWAIRLPAPFALPFTEHFDLVYHLRW